MGDIISDFFGDGDHCVNCGDDLNRGTESSFCETCRQASGNERANRQLAYLERIGDVKGAANVRQSIADAAAELEQAEQAYQRVLGNTASNADRQLVVNAGWGQYEYDDPESNRPTGIVITRDDPPGDPYADQAALEERAANHRL